MLLSYVDAVSLLSLMSSMKPKVALGPTCQAQLRSSHSLLTLLAMAASLFDRGQPSFEESSESIDEEDQEHLYRLFVG